MKQKKYRLTFLLIFIILISVFSIFLFSNFILKILASNLIETDHLRKSDAIVVLGGEAPSRMLEAIDLYNKGFSEIIIITRGGKPEGLDYLNSKGIEYPEEPEINKYLANKFNIDEHTILLLPGRVYSTKEEAELVKDYSIKNGIKTLIVTTSKSHSKRAKIIFNDVFEGTDIKILIRPSGYDSFDTNNLSANKYHWKQVVNEYQKLLYYYADELN
ncbi:MAG: YdcF family protein [Thermodesulfobacteriota bacterium]